MADQPADKVTMRAVTFEELMEVVTSYKCRICDFSASSKSDMAKHLHKVHISSGTPCGPAQQPPEGQQGSKPDDETGAGPSVLPECGVLAEAGAEIAEAGDGSEGVVCTTGSADTTRIYNTPTFFSNLGLTSSQAASSSPRSLLPDPKVLTSQMRSVAKNLPAVAASSQSDIQLLSLNSNSAGRQSLTITNLQLTGSGLSLLPTSTSTSMDSVPFVENPKDLGTGPASIAPITKELFLCGVCRLGFTSADECNMHMEQVHSVQVEGACVSDTVIDRLEQRVSVGTQATGKRPGRKRKSEMPPPVSPPPARKSREWSDYGRGDDDENDDDWIPGRSLSSETRDGRQRRKIRAPKALKEDYVTEKKRTYRKKQMVVKDSYQLECSYMGCPTKFRSQEALDMHHKCHNKEDDAFTCVQCHEPFQFWKPLRIHLYRAHKVDCDMFQCDMCEYKTDTLHKLGVHREIHSEQRPYTCDVCGKGFKQLSQMKNHQIIHAEHQRVGRDSWFSNKVRKVCEVCKRTFANSKCLKKHVEAVHGQNKPFKCQYCSHTTSWKAMLILHERTHTGEKPFKCDVCSYATGDHNSLRRHKMRHTGQRQYKCQLCSYTCIQTISLKTHMRNKHPSAEGVVYQCGLCKFRTINKQIYDNHLEDHRNGLVATEKAVDPAGVPPGHITVTTATTLDNGMAGLPDECPVSFQLQVKRMETGELHANKEDMDRLNALPQLVHSGVDANQLIYTALNIGSHIDGLSYTAQLANGVQSTVLPTLQPSKGVMSSYSITFQSPHPQAHIPHGPPPIHRQQQQQQQAPVVVDFQSLAEEEMGDGLSSSEEPSVQGVGDGEEGGVEVVGDRMVMRLAEVAQASGIEEEEVEEQQQTLYTHLPPQQGEHQPGSQVSGDAATTFQVSGFKVLQVPDTGTRVSIATATMSDTVGTHNTPPPPPTPAAAAASLVVSQAVDGVLGNIIVMEDAQEMTMESVERIVEEHVVVEDQGGEVVQEGKEGEVKVEVDSQPSTEGGEDNGEGQEGGLGVLEKVLVMAADEAQGCVDNSAAV